MTVDAEDVLFADVLATLARTFRHEAERRKLYFEVGRRPRPAAAPRHRQQAPAAGAQEPAVERLQVHRAGRRARCTSAKAVGGWTRDHPVLDARRDRGGLRSHRHRHRHPAGEAEDHLRGVPAGRRGHQPQVRRHGPRPGDQPRARGTARRRDRRCGARPARAARSRSTCRCATSARRSRGPGPGRRRRGVRRAIDAGGAVDGAPRRSRSPLPVPDDRETSRPGEP